jgi:hypothetical protein
MYGPSLALTVGRLAEAGPCLVANANANPNLDSRGERDRA